MRNLIFVFIAFGLVSPAVAKSAKKKDPRARGLAIFKQAEDRDDGFGDTVAKAKMILKDKSGKESPREFDVSVLEVKDDGDKTLIRFSAPAYLARTALLTFPHANDDDERWLYLPASKRVKRISGGNQSGAFVGSEFSYEDLTAPILENFKYKYLRDEKVGKHNCFVVERYPKDKESGYKKHVVWMDKKMYMPRKVEYYDRKDTLLKTQSFTKYRKYLKKYWRAHHQDMVNVKTGKSTILNVSTFKFKQGLASSDFAKAKLKLR